MARKKKSDETVAGAEFSSPEAGPELADDSAVESLETKTVEIPLAPLPPDGFTSRHADARLNLPQAQSLRRLRIALEADNRTLASGKRINGQADCIRWILEQLA